MFFFGSKYRFGRAIGLGDRLKTRKRRNENADLDRETTETEDARKSLNGERKRIDRGSAGGDPAPGTTPVLR